MWSPRIADLSTSEQHFTKLVRKGESWRLNWNGKEFFVKGAGGTGSRSLLLECGGNSIRTWGADDLGQVLDQAQKDGIAVTAGIWLGHTGAFDYGNKEAVKAQLEMCRKVVSTYKDHPALLVWAFGNEMEGDGRDPRVWEAVEEIAAMAKKIDPNHPTMTVIAEIGDDKVKNIQRVCKSIDVIGINSYGGAPTLHERYLKQGGTKPYIVTEFGPLGPWEVPKTRWGAPMEQTSTEKAAFYRSAYLAAVQNSKGLCLGSYAFLWGEKQEATATWFGMLLPDGTALPPVDVMTEFWTGKSRRDKAPEIQSVSVTASDFLTPGQRVKAVVQAKDPEGAPLNIRWVLSDEAKVRLAAGQGEPKLKEYPNAVSKSESSSAEIVMPSEEGAYRLFVYVYDGKGNAATANVPLFVGKR